MTAWKDQIPGAFTFFAGFPARPAPFGLHQPRPHADAPPHPG
jgi:hypothetical protein